MIGKIRYSYIIILIAIVIFVGGYFMTVTKKKNEYSKIKSDYQKKSEELTKARAVAEKKDKTLLEYMIVKKRWEKANEMLPPSITMTNLLNEISRYAGISGVKILDFKPAPNVVDKGGYGEFTMDMNISGGYHDIAKFLAAINNMPRIVNVNSISIKVEKEEKLTASLNLSAYVGGKGGVKHEEKKKTTRK